MSEKGITQQEFDELQEAANALESAFNDFDTALRNAAPQMYERWKAYGKQVRGYQGPVVAEVMEKLAADIVPDDEDEEDNPCHADCIYSERGCEGCDQIKSESI